jgi:hypothetical protein
MSTVIAGLSMSVDGCAADPDDGVGRVFTWYSAGGTDAEVRAGDLVQRGVGAVLP